MLGLKPPALAGEVDLQCVDSCAFSRVRFDDFSRLHPGCANPPTLVGDSLVYPFLAFLVFSPQGSIAAEKASAKKPAKVSVKVTKEEAAEPVSANKPVVTHISAAIAALKADPEVGRQINGVCAACYGDSGQGGKKGEYPRRAG